LILAEDVKHFPDREARKAHRQALVIQEKGKKKKKRKNKIE